MVFETTGPGRTFVVPVRTVVVATLSTLELPLALLVLTIVVPDTTFVVVIGFTAGSLFSCSGVG